MPVNDGNPFGSIIRKLEKLAKLDDADRVAIASLPFTFRSAPAGQ